MLDGRVPEALDWPPACRFEPRCPNRWIRCAQESPRVIDFGDGATVRCNLYDTDIADRPNASTSVTEEAPQ